VLIASVTAQISSSGGKATRARGGCHRKSGLRVRQAPQNQHAITAQPATRAGLRRSSRDLQNDLHARLQNMYFLAVCCKLNAGDLQVFSASRNPLQNVCSDFESASGGSTPPGATTAVPRPLGDGSRQGARAFRTTSSPSTSRPSFVSSARAARSLSPFVSSNAGSRSPRLRGGSVIPVTQTWNALESPANPLLRASRAPPGSSGR
jgi:hypothetical protein